MIQDIGEHTFDNQFYNVSSSNEDALVIVKDKQVLVKVEGIDISFPKVKEANCNNLFYLFKLDEVRYFSTLEDIEIDGYQYVPAYEFRNFSPHHYAFVLITGYQIVSWYKNNVYCSKCGKPMRIGDKERNVICDECGHMLYPQICPAVIVGITNGNDLLITKYIGGKNYALVAGYNEVGETIEETVIREVKEETGLEVTNLKYYKSQPWGLTSSMLFGFYCEVVGDTTITRDDKELEEAKWCPREEIPIGYLTSLTAEMMYTFKVRGRDVYK